MYVKHKEKLKISKKASKISLCALGTITKFFGGISSNLVDICKIRQRLAYSLPSVSLTHSNILHQNVGALLANRSDLTELPEFARCQEIIF